MMIPVGTAFATIAGARDAIYKALLDVDLSWVVDKTATTSLLLRCKDAKEHQCAFVMRAAWSIKEGAIILWRYDPHICTCYTHSNFRGKQLVKYLKEEHRAVILRDRKTTPAFIKDQEGRVLRNRIEYIQAWRIKKNV